MKWAGGAVTPPPRTRKEYFHVKANLLTSGSSQVEVAIAPPRQAQQRLCCELEPGLRIIEGRVLYSAAWLDQAARRLKTSDADARLARPRGAGLGG
jgi:hypothetical protein